MGQALSARQSLKEIAFDEVTISCDPFQVVWAETPRNRNTARLKKRLPISAMAKNSGHTTSRPAPR
jgi:hypothetical protein